MSNEEFLCALRDLIQRAENEEGYLEYLKDDVKELLEKEEE